MTPNGLMLFLPRSYADELKECHRNQLSGFKAVAEVRKHTMRAIGVLMGIKDTLANIQKSTTTVNIL